MSDSVFRPKSVEKIGPPEKLNDYIRISSPGIWIILLGACLILIGMLVWGIFGRVEETMDDGSSRYVAPITFITN
jgi:hypothetical protein